MSEIFKEIKHLSRHAVIYGLSNMLSKAVGFLMIPVYTRYLSPSDYGILELLALSMSVLGVIVGMGLAEAVVRFYAMYGEIEKKRMVVSSSVILFSSILFAVMVFCCYFQEAISNILFSDTQYANFVKISLITFAFNSLLEIPLVYIRALERSVFFSVVAFFRLILALSLNIYFLVFMKLGVIGILYSGLITSVTVSSCLLVFTLKETRMRFDVEIVLEMLKFSIPLIFHGIGAFVINFGDRFFLKEVASLSEVGIYSLGYKFGMMVMSFVIYQPFFLIWSVRRYEVIKKPEGEEIYSKVFLIFGMVMLFFCFALSIYAFEIVSMVADSRYIGSCKFIPLIAFSYVLRTYGDFFLGILLIEKKTKHMSIITISSTVVCILSYYLLIPRWYGMGAACATLLTFLFLSITSFFVSQKIRPINYPIQKTAIACTAGIALWYISTQLGTSFQLTTILIKLILLVIFSVTILLLLNVKSYHFSKLYAQIFNH